MWDSLQAVLDRVKPVPHHRLKPVVLCAALLIPVAFSVASYKDSPLENLQFRNIDVAAKSAGAIHNASGWKFDNVHIAAADGSSVAP